MYKVLDSLRAKVTCNHYETFEEALRAYQHLIKQINPESCWAEGQYRDTKIQKWDEKKEKYVDVK